LQNPGRDCRSCEVRRSNTLSLAASVPNGLTVPTVLFSRACDMRQSRTRIFFELASSPISDPDRDFCVLTCEHHRRIARSPACLWQIHCSIFVRRRLTSTSLHSAIPLHTIILIQTTKGMSWKAGLSRYLPAMRFFACPESPSSIGVRYVVVRVALPWSRTSHGYGRYQASQSLSASLHHQLLWTTCTVLFV
jgi:hypothetical protein